MAAKRKRKRTRTRKSPVRTWVALVVGLVIAAVAAIAVLSDGRLLTRSSPIGEFGEAPEAEKQHDRDQIDQASRDQLREILRAADDAEDNTEDNTEDKGGG